MKTHWSELALFGGRPTFETSRHVGCPNIGDRERLSKRLEAILDRRWLSNGGPMVAEFEERVARVAGVSHAIAVSHGTAALELTLRGLGLTGEVIVPSCTFVATAHAAKWAGLNPVFCDVNERTANLCPRSVAKTIDENTQAILGVHLWGRASEVDELQALADAYGIPLLFDASHAFGCTYEGRRVGSLGRAEVFSFHATKFVNAFEGGAITTDDAELANRVRRLKNFGFDEQGTVCGLGTNAKMSEISAAMGLTSLESASEFVLVNRSHHVRYLSRLSGIEGLRFLAHAPQEKTNYQYVVLLVDPEKSGIHRDTLMKILVAENILARRYFYPGVHRMEPYRSESKGVSLPVTERLLDQTLCLPTGTGMSPEDVDRVCDVIELAVRQAQGVREGLNEKTSVHGGSRDGERVAM